MLLDYFEAFETNAHEYYTYRLYLCEYANFVFLLVNVWLTNWVTDGLFWSLGPDIFKNGYHSIVLIKLFPSQGKCTWRVTGPSGNVQPFDALCVRII